MPPRSPEKLRKVTLNLFDKDCAAMERYYGHGWSEVVRDMVHRHIRETYPRNDWVNLAEFVEPEDAE